MILFSYFEPDDVKQNSRLTPYEISTQNIEWYS